MSDVLLPEVIDPRQKQHGLDGYWSPGILGMVNSTAVKLARLKGDFVWHSHEEQDELFMVLEGTLTIEFRHGSRLLQAGQMLIVPRGLEHRPVAMEECLVLLVEPIDTVNTGNTPSELRRDELPLL